MAQHDFHFIYSTHADTASLTEIDQHLIARAMEACAHAYAPYSDFKVGVAIRTSDGDMVTGSNQENGAYPIGQCAERVALYRMTHELGRKTIDTIAITVDNVQQRSPATPCGSCRQLLNEYRSFQANSIRLLLTNKATSEVVEINDIADLLPLAFDGKFLGQ